MSPETGTCPLTKLGSQRAGTVVGIDLEFVVRERLAALGVRPGRQIRVVRRARAGGPLQIRVGGTDLLIRAEDAARIRVEPGSPR